MGESGAFRGELGGVKSLSNRNQMSLILASLESSFVVVSSWGARRLGARYD
jgi:hypothetical protein